MKKSMGVRPAVESLESMMLLSTLTASWHEIARPAALVAAEAVKSTDVALHGIVRGTGTLDGTTLTAHGQGNLGRVGVATISGSGDLLHPPSTLTVTTRRGVLTLAATETPVLIGTTGHVTYSVSGGTNAFASASGSGLLTGHYTLRGGDKIAFTLRFS